MKDTENGQILIDKFIEANKGFFSPKNNFLCVDRHTNKIFCTQTMYYSILL